MAGSVGVLQCKGAEDLTDLRQIGASGEFKPDKLDPFEINAKLAFIFHTVDGAYGKVLCF